jgi:tetratricopeptide (TPR) repeat protein
LFDAALHDIGMDMLKIISIYFLIPVFTLTLCPFNFFSFDSLSYCFAQSDTKLALPNNAQPGSLISKAKIYMEKNNFPLALRHLNEALKKSPRQAEVYLLRGKTLDRMGLPMKALQDLKKYIELRPQDPAGFIQRADINNFNSDHKAAVQDYNRALRILPNSRAALVGRGLAFAAMGNYDLAIQDYKGSLLRYPRDHEAWANLGMAYHLSGKNQSALESFLKALELEPDRDWRIKIDRIIQQLSAEIVSENPRKRGPTKFRSNPAGGMW